MISRLLILVLCLPLSAAEIDLSKALKKSHKPKLETPRGAEMFGGNRRMVRKKALAISTQTRLAWVNENTLPVWFDVESSPNPDGPWTLIGTTDQTSFPIQLNKSQEFFRVGARWK